MFNNLLITCFLGMFTIILGAFGAHVLKETLTAEALSSFETAVRYQMYHVIILLFVNSYEGFSPKQKNKISTIFYAGIFLFSGSIYVIQLTSISAKNIWFVTPLGGVFLILGWAAMIVIFVKKYRMK